MLTVVVVPLTVKSPANTVLPATAKLAPTLALPDIVVCIPVPVPIVTEASI